MIKLLFTLGFQASFFILGVSACSTSPTEKEWIERKNNPVFAKEKALFKERLGGKEICSSVGLFDFVILNGPNPNYACLYPTSKLEPTDNHNIALGQHRGRLEIVQVSHDGFLVKSVFPGGKNIFVHKTDESGLVDGSFIDSAPSGMLYEYAGPFSYDSAFGRRTIHSFKKIELAQVQKAHIDLSIYNPNDEVLANLEIWKQLKESFQKREKQSP